MKVLTRIERASRAKASVMLRLYSDIWKPASAMKPINAPNKTIADYCRNRFS